MARKKSDGGLGGFIVIVGLIVIGLASIPRSVWYTILIVGGLAGAAYLAYIIFRKANAQEPPHAVPGYVEDPAPRPLINTDWRNDTGSGTSANRSLADELGITVRVSYSGMQEVSRKRLPPTSQQTTPEQCWVAPGHTVEVKGHSTLGGMLYFGRNLPSVSRQFVEPALINPDERVDWTGFRERMPYWPSYDAIEPSSRADYLTWLIGGRQDPRVQMGCVFLYFYGLERRVLHDVDTYPDAVAAEIPAIREEVERLLGIYRHNGSFSNYASAFLDVLTEGAKVSDKAYLSEPPAFTGVKGLHFSHRVALGQAARDGVPLPAKWAYSWFMHDPMSYPKTVMERCPEEFRKVFTVLYNHTFADGMKLPVNKTKLKLTYRPASASFGQTLEFNAGDIPDVTVLERPIGQLRKIAEDACESLAAYSRLIGRSPEKAGTMDAIVLLPPVLWPKDSIVSLRTWLTQLGVEREMQACSLSELMSHFPHWGKMDRDRLSAFGYALEQFGVGMEPDVRWGSPLPSEGAPVVLFHIPKEERGKKPSNVYAAAALTLHLSAAVAHADGVSAEEEQHLEENVERMLHLQGHERLRLRAHLKWLLLSKPSLIAMKKRVSALDTAQREAIGNFVVHLAQFEGGLSPEEMKALAKVYRALELPEEKLYSQAHAVAAAPSTEPVTMKAAGKKDKGYAVPAKPAPKDAEPAALDAARIAKLKEESAQVSALLGNIFAGEDEAPLTTDAEETASQEPTLVGLDTEHSHFARILMTRDRWTRAELEDLAADRGLMLDGAMERVNEAFLDSGGEALLDGTDPVEVNPNALKEAEPA